MFGPAEKDVAVGEIESARVAGVRIVGGQVADVSRRQIDLHGIAEGLGEEENALAVMRPVGALAEGCESKNVRGQMISWTLSGRRRGSTR